MAGRPHVLVPWYATAVPRRQARGGAHGDRADRAALRRDAATRSTGPTTTATSSSTRPRSRRSSCGSSTGTGRSSRAGAPSTRAGTRCRSCTPPRTRSRRARSSTSRSSWTSSARVGSARRASPRRRRLRAAAPARRAGVRARPRHRPRAPAGRRRDGLGEDITTYLPEGSAAPELPLAGEWTLGSFCAHLAGVDQWPEAAGVGPGAQLAQLGATSRPRWTSRCGRRAVARGTRSGARRGPVRFVNSLGLGDPPQSTRSARAPGSLPAPALQARRRARRGRAIARGARGHRRRGHGRLQGPVRARGRGPRRARAALRARAWSLPRRRPRGPARRAGDREVLAPHADRVSYDAPIRSVADLAAVASRRRRSTSSPRASAAPAAASSSTPTATPTASACTAAGWASWAWPRADRAAGVALPPRHAQRRRAPRRTTTSTRPPGCRRARSTPRAATTGFRRE